MISPLTSHGKTTKQIGLSDAERDVIEFVKSYASHVRLTGEAVLARWHGRTPNLTRITAEVTNASVIVNAWANPSLGADGIYADGNTLSFSYGGENFAVDNELAVQITAAPKQLRKRLPFAHDALAYDADSGRIEDPLRALTGEVIHLNKSGRSLPETLDIVLRGLIDSANLDLGLDGAFKRLAERVLEAAGGRPAIAGQILSVLLGRLATLIESLTPEKLTKLLTSKLIKSALLSTLGIDASALVKQFAELRASADAETSDSALWLSLILGPQLLTNGVQGLWAMESGNRADTLRSRAAVSAAREFLSSAAS